MAIMKSLPRDTTHFSLTTRALELVLVFEYMMYVMYVSLVLHVRTYVCICTLYYLTAYIACFVCIRMRMKIVVWMCGPISKLSSLAVRLDY